jgi:hypothetical protein
MKTYTFSIEILGIGYEITVDAYNDSDASDKMWTELRRQTTVVRTEIKDTEKRSRLMNYLMNVMQ